MKPFHRGGFTAVLVAGVVLVSSGFAVVSGTVAKPGGVCSKAGASVVSQGVSLVCKKMVSGKLVWRVAKASTATTVVPTTTTATTTTTTAPKVAVVAPRVVSASSATGNAVITIADMSPDTGVYAVQWVPVGQSFNSFSMYRTTTKTMTVPYLSCTRTYTLRVFVMQENWQMTDGFVNQNVTPHSATFDLTMPACRDVATGVALTPSFGTPTSAAGGFTVQISNYDALFTWAGTATGSGVVAINGSGLVTVSGVAARTSSTATITTTRSGYSGGSATVTATSQCDPDTGVCVVGDTGPGGGIVFYVQAAGGTFTCGATLASTCKYLEAAPTSGTNAWTDATRTWATNTSSNQTTAVSGADGTAIDTGYQNSLDIVGQTGNVALTSAAVEAQAYRGPNSKTDWHLPSKDELNQMCKWQRGVAWVSDATVCTGGTLNSGTGASGFSTVTYWSSSEDAATTAWSQRFDNGYQYYNDKAYLIKTFTYYVRPVRAFG